MVKPCCGEFKEKINKEVFEWADAIIVAVIFFVFTFTVFLRVAVVSGSSMLPTLLDGDWVIIYNFLYNPEKNDIVVIDDMETLKEPIIKRIIATENDEIRIDETSGQVYVNGVLQDDMFCYSRESTYNGDYEFPKVIPSGFIFVMGDNRENSLDSRYKVVGLVKKEKVLGKAKAVIFPFNRMKFFN